ncbi:MAG: hypothetical protein IKR33_06855 [Bacteroidales bacterium]|nr:hypothetical protein [Bacteroidales bacterium]
MRDIRIAVIATTYDSIAIWNCMKQHINLMLDTGASLSIFSPTTEKATFIQGEFLPITYRFSGRGDLRRKIREMGINLIWYPTALTMVHYGCIGRNLKRIFWIQGSVADESWLRNHNRFRRFVLNMIEKYAIHKSDGLVYVSEAMKMFYEKKYNKCFFKYAIVPCVSDFHNFEPTSERIPESYVYIGGLSKWQCFEEMVDVYAKVRTANSIWHIITMEKEKAERIIAKKLGKARDVYIYSITDRSKIPHVLSTFQYGFLIRKESPVNYVSSPIKFLEYLSCGVNVIMTDAVPSYSNIVKQFHIGTIVDLNQINKVKIAQFSPDARNVYEACFDKEQFVRQYKEIIDNIFK